MFWNLHFKNQHIKKIDLKKNEDKNISVVMKVFKR